MLRRLFKENGVRNAVTLFHSPSSSDSVRVLSILQAAHLAGKEPASPSKLTALSDEKFPKLPQAPFDLDVVEEAPTQDQLKTILDFAGSSSLKHLIPNASNVGEALGVVSRQPNKFQRPLVVDWNSGKLVFGDNEPELQELLKSIPRD